MSGYGVPFRLYPLQKADTKGAPLPSQVKEIHDYDTCMVFAKEAADNARMRAQQRNDPRYYEYANWFDEFAHSQKATQTFCPHGSGNFTLDGGCKLLLIPDSHCESRTQLWNEARNDLFDQLFRYHTNTGFPSEGPSQQIHY